MVAPGRPDDAASEGRRVLPRVVQLVLRARGPLVGRRRADRVHRALDQDRPVDVQHERGRGRPDDAEPARVVLRLALHADPPGAAQADVRADDLRSRV